MSGEAEDNVNAILFDLLPSNIASASDEDQDITDATLVDPTAAAQQVVGAHVINMATSTPLPVGDEHPGVKFPKLTVKTYEHWRLATRALIYRDMCEDVINQPRPSNPDSDFILRERKAWTHILLNLDQQHARMVRESEPEEARDIWMRFEKLYLSKTQTSVMSMWLALYSTKYTGGDVQTYTRKILQLAADLRLAKETISDGSIRALLITSFLPVKGYEGTIASFDAVDPDNCTVEYVEKRLIERGEQLLVIKGMEKASGNQQANQPKLGQGEEKALQFSSYPSQGGGGKKGKRKKGKQGSGQSQQQQRSGNNSSAGQSRHYTKPCLYCGMENHSRDQCHSLRKAMEGGGCTSLKKPTSGNVATSQTSAKSYAVDVDHDEFGCCAWTGPTPTKRARRRQPAVEPPRETACFSGAGKHHTWILDSGASRHMTGDRSFFIDLEPLDIKVHVAGGPPHWAKGVGTGRLHSVITEGDKNVKLHNVLYVPSFQGGLIGISVLDRQGCVTTFEGGVGTVRYTGPDDHVHTLLRAHLSDGLYRLDTDHADAAPVTALTCQHQWHRRLGHRDPRILLRLHHEQLATGFEVKDCAVRHDVCEPCLLGKMSQRPFKDEGERAGEVLDHLHSDLCGPIPVTSPGGMRYYLSIIDDHSRHVAIRLLKKKSDAAAAIKDYVVETRTQKGLYPKRFHSDNGTEYVNQDLLDFFREKGTIHTTTVPDTPQHNGVAERMNRTLCEMMRAMLADSGMDPKYWAEAVQQAAFIHNKIPGTSVPTTPHEEWFGTKPDLSKVRAFGSKVWTWIPKHARRKLDDHAKAGILIGYVGSRHGYKVLNPATGGMYFSRTVKIVEPPCHHRGVKPEFEGAGGLDSRYDVLLPDTGSQPTTTTKDAAAGHDTPRKSPQKSPLKGKTPSPPKGKTPSPPKGRTPTPAKTTPPQQRSPPQSQPSSPDVFHSPEQSSEWLLQEEEGYGDADSSESSEDEQGRVRESILPPQPSRRDSTAEGPRRSQRERSAPDRYGASAHVAEVPTVAEEIPDSWDAVTRLPPDQRAVWTAAANEEMKSLRQHDVWELATLAPGHHAVGCRWVFTTKKDGTGAVHTYKARLVARGFTQRYGLDYDETYAPVVSHDAVRLLLAVAAVKQLHVRHMDVRTAYLNAPLQEEIYMRQPPGFIDRHSPDKVLRLKRSLYGLRQSARAWNIRATRELRKIGFRRGKKEPCMFTRQESGANTTYVVLYVDDILIAGSTPAITRSVGEQLGQAFQMKDLGEVRLYLGYNIEREEDGSFLLDQREKIAKLLDRLNLTGTIKTAPTPMEVGYLQGEDPQHPSPPLPDCERYRSATGMLNYLACGTRPDIAYAVSVLCRFNHRATERDWKAVKRVGRYLLGTYDFKLRLPSSGQPTLSAYADADYAGDPKDRLSTSGYIIFFGDSPVGWSSKKQESVVLSSTESELVAATACGRDVKGTRMILAEMGIRQTSPTILYEDNQSCLAIIDSDRMSGRLKHIDTKDMYVRELQRHGHVEGVWCPGEDMIADILTKALPRTQYEFYASRLGLVRRGAGRASAECASVALVCAASGRPSGVTSPQLAAAAVEVKCPVCACEGEKGCWRSCRKAPVSHAAPTRVQIWRRSGKEHQVAARSEHFQ
jgi:transposase InsO family protein